MLRRQLRMKTVAGTFLSSTTFLNFHHFELLDSGNAMNFIEWARPASNFKLDASPFRDRKCCYPRSYPCIRVIRGPILFSKQRVTADYADHTDKKVRDATSLPAQEDNRDLMRSAIRGVS